MDIAQASGNGLEAADRYHAAAFAAGCALVAHKSQLGILELCIQQKRHCFDGSCQVRRFGRPKARLEFLLAGEAAQVALGLSGFSPVSIWEGNHRDAALLIENWDMYWGKYYPIHSPEDKEDFCEQEIIELIDLTRYQLRRRFSHKSERNTLETLALRLRDATKLSGQEVTSLIRSSHRDAINKVEVGQR